MLSSDGAIVGAGPLTAGSRDRGVLGGYAALLQSTSLGTHPQRWATVCVA